MLKFPDLIREKDGLRLAQALRDGAEAGLREGLAEAAPEGPGEEAALIAGLLAGLEAPAPDPRKGGRPKRAEGPQRALSSGFTLQAQEDARGWMIRIGGHRPVGRDLIDTLIAELQRLLDRPG